MLKTTSQELRSDPDRPEPQGSSELRTDRRRAALLAFVR